MSTNETQKVKWKIRVYIYMFFMDLMLISEVKNAVRVCKKTE